MASISGRGTALIAANIEGVLREGGTPQCSVWVETPSGQLFCTTIHRQHARDIRCGDCERDDTLLYNIGSMTKLFVAYALVILVEKLANSDDPGYSRFRALREAWDKGIRKYLKIRLPGEPTIDNLLSHFNGIPSMNDFIFGPDGTVLMTMDEFPEIAEHVAWEYYKSKESIPIWRYGNGSYILAGILIETYSGVPLGNFLDDNIFRPYNMASTCVSLEAFEKLPPGAIAPPHIVSADLCAKVIKYPRFFGTPAFSAMGIYSCTKDLAAFFRKLLDTLSNKEAVAPQDFEVVNRFLHPCVKFQEETRGFYGFCGLFTNLCTSQPGNSSLNRLVTTAESNASNYTLGADATGTPLEVIHGSGTVTGYECCFYFMPECKSFVIVLSNATGLVDASDHIARLLLQDLFDLKYKPLKLNRMLGRTKLSKAPAVDFIQKARVGAEERRRFMNQLFLPTILQATYSPASEFIGNYINEKYRQFVVISCNSVGFMQVQICGTAGRSKPFNVQLVDKLTLALSQSPDDNLPFLSVDVFQDWKSLQFVIGRDQSGKVASLTRSREAFGVIYTRSRS